MFLIRKKTALPQCINDFYILQNYDKRNESHGSDKSKSLIIKFIVNHMEQVGSQTSFELSHIIRVIIYYIACTVNFKIHLLDILTFNLLKKIKIKIASLKREIIHFWK